MANPFVYDRPLPPAQLVDRAPELEELLGLATAGHAARLSGPRRYGKTTLLGALADVAWQAHDMVAAVVDLSAVTSVEDLTSRLVRAYERGLDRGALRGVFRTLRRRVSAGATLGVPGVASVGGTLSTASPQAVEALHDALDLPRRVHERTGHRCLVVLDEFQDVLVVDDRLDGLFRSHLQHHGDAASYVFAGSQPSLLRAIFGDRRRALFEQARPLELGPLPAPDLADWIEARLAAAGRDGLLELVDPLVGLSEGHPQRAMLLAHALFEQDDDDDDALDGAVRLALRIAGDSLESTWRALSVAERRVLAAVAAGHARVLGGAALAATGMSKSTQAQVRDALVDGCHLRALDAGGMALVDPLLGAWLASHGR